MDIGKGVVVVTFLEIDGVQDFNAVLIAPQRISALRHDTALGVCDHEADRIGFGCALEQIGFQPEAGLTGAASPDD